jgi:DNA-binding MarR family transcriptional regulator
MTELASEQRWVVLLALIEKKEMYFNEIKRDFGAESAQVDTILKHLVAGGFVARRVLDVGEIGDRRKTYYKPTPLAYAVVNAIAEAFLPKKASILVSTTDAGKIPLPHSYATPHPNYWQGPHTSLGMPEQL